MSQSHFLSNNIILLSNTKKIDKASETDSVQKQCCCKIFKRVFNKIAAKKNDQPRWKSVETIFSKHTVTKQINQKFQMFK